MDNHCGARAHRQGRNGLGNVIATLFVRLGHLRSAQVVVKRGKVELLFTEQGYRFSGGSGDLQVAADEAGPSRLNAGFIIFKE